jgi:hypothetical protein
LKKLDKRFGDSKIMLTFAAPFKKRTEVKELKFLNRLKQESKN